MLLAPLARSLFLGCLLPVAFSAALAVLFDGVQLFSTASIMVEFSERIDASWPAILVCAWSLPSHGKLTRGLWVHVT